MSERYLQYCEDTQSTIQTCQKDISLKHMKITKTFLPIILFSISISGCSMSPRENYDFKYWNANFSSETTTCRLVVKQATSNFGNISNPVIELRIINHDCNNILLKDVHGYLQFYLFNGNKIAVPILSDS